MHLQLLAVAAALASPALARLNPHLDPILQARHSQGHARHHARAETPPADGGAQSASRFRNADTERFVVTSMPEVNFDFGEMYAGTIPLNPRPNKGAAQGGAGPNANAGSSAGATSSPNANTNSGSGDSGSNANAGASADSGAVPSASPSGNGSAISNSNANPGSNSNVVPNSDANSGGNSSTGGSSAPDVNANVNFAPNVNVNSDSASNANVNPNSSSSATSNGNGNSDSGSDADSSSTVDSGSNVGSGSNVNSGSNADSSSSPDSGSNGGSNAGANAVPSANVSPSGGASSDANAIPSGGVSSNSDASTNSDSNTDSNVNAVPSGNATPSANVAPAPGATSNSGASSSTDASSNAGADPIKDAGSGPNASSSGAAGITGPAGNTSQEDEMFFIFMPKEGEPVDELTIWLNGGPGCSSMEGFLQEVGPISWQGGTYAPVRNMYAWTNLTNMLFVDQPIGTGYSTGTPTATTQEESAAQFLDFLKKFETLFGIKNFKIYVAGESYAGRYVPYIADAMLQSKDSEHFNVSGALIYDPVIGSNPYVQQQVTAYPYIEENWSHFGFNATDMAALKQMHQECGYEKFIADFMTFPASGVQPPLMWDKKNRANPFTAKCDLWNTALLGTLSLNPCFDAYETNKPCPILWDVLGMSGMVSFTPPGTQVYFDRADVKAALHAPDVKWTQCSKKPVYIGDNAIGGPGQNGDLSPDPIQGALPRVIDATQRVLVANGDFDYVIITNGTLLAIQNMTWGGELGFHAEPKEALWVDEPDKQWAPLFAANDLASIIMPQGHMGVQHFERGLMWNQVWGAGHMLPAYQPRVAYQQLEWVLGRKDTLG